LLNVLFSGNLAYGGYMASAMWVSGETTLTNVVFADNVGGVATLVIDGNTTATNVTIFQTYGVQGVMLIAGGESAMSNSILWDYGNPGAPIFVEDGVITIDHSLIQDSGGSGPAWDTSLGIDGGGNFDADPSFVDIGNGDYRLQTGSPAIDTGDATAFPPDVTTDLDGNPRIVGGEIDMGAYEWQGTVRTSTRSFGAFKGRFVPKKEDH
jgi:hypothetical protein